MPEPTRDSIISRVVRILSCFDRSTAALSLSSLARRSGLPLTTAHRITDELLRHGLLERDSAGDLRPGLRMWELANRASHALTLREACLPFMEDVQAAVHHHVTLAVLDRGSALYVERLSAPESPLAAANIAQRMPLHASSSGLVLLAFSEAAVQARALAGPLEKVTPETVTDPAALRRTLADIRQKGFAAPPGIGRTEWIGVAVPVFGSERTAEGPVIAAALNAILPRTEADLVPRVVVALTTAAHGATRALRGTIGQPATP
ncbi:IclR family transcriptional regulator [Sinomonas sp. P10A9]|uniref:IclR family transcriptional regulator n=1 Tax=Sinomonas puerhi TaxID=3238584 RepID=A0AB39L5R0_9MICC